MDKETMRQKVEDCLQKIYDPELPVSIFELGLIYEINISDDYVINIVMTLTAPGCPAAQSLPVEVDNRIREIEGVKDVFVSVTWSPAWNKTMMSEAAQLELGFM